MTKATEGTAALKAAREQSLTVLEEQSAMLPVPSQADLDKIKLGHAVPADEKQPDGPAAEAAETQSVANAEALAKAETPDGNAAVYKTRANKAG